MENGRSLDPTGTTGPENAAELALTAFLWWRADIPQDVCEDVHGIMFARAPGMWQYRQLRLADNHPDLWPAVQDVSFDVPAAAQPQGIGHALFLTEAALAAFGSNPIAREAIPDDAHNFMSRNGAQLSPLGGGHTLVDRIDDPGIQGAPSVPTFVVCFVPRPGAASTETFHRFLADHVGRPWSEQPGVMRLRVEPLPPHDRSAMATPGVAHQWPSDRTYLSWIELAVRDEGVVSDLLADVAADEFARHVEAVHSYPVREIYTIISAGRPTDVGLRGYPAVHAISALGADNQRSESVLKLLFGDAVRGLEQIRRSA